MTMSRMGLTGRARELLDFIEHTVRQHRVSPSYEEMRCALDLKSKSGVARLIEQLEERGHIRTLPGRARAIELCADDPVHLSLPPDLYIRLAEEASRRGLDVNEALAEAVRTFLTGPSSLIAPRVAGLPQERRP